MFLPSFIVFCFQTVAILPGDCSALRSRPMPQKFWSNNMCLTSRRNAVKISSLFANRFSRTAVFNFEMRSKSHGLRSGQYGGCCKISHPNTAKGSGHKLQCGLLHYHGELLHFLEVLDVSSAIYEAYRTA